MLSRWGWYMQLVSPSCLLYQLWPPPPVYFSLCPSHGQGHWSMSGRFGDSSVGQLSDNWAGETTALLPCHSCPRGPLSSKASLHSLVSSEFTLGKEFFILFSHPGVSHFLLPSWGIMSLTLIKKSLEIIFQGREALRGHLGSWGSRAYVLSWLDIRVVKSEGLRVDKLGLIPVCPLDKLLSNSRILLPHLYCKNSNSIHLMVLLWELIAFKVCSQHTAPGYHGVCCYRYYCCHVAGVVS